MNETTKKKIALFKNIEYESITEFTESMDNSKKYIRISEYENIEFKMLKPEETIKKEIENLDFMAEEIRQKALEGLNKINQRKEELMAITFNPEN